MARAREFYAACCEWSFDADRIAGRPGIAIAELPEAAANRGAPSHWLGTLGVADHAALLRTWLQEGGRRLGAPDSPIVADPGGAILALGQTGTPLDVVCLLHCSDLEAATASYHACGWDAGRVQTGPQAIRSRSFGPRIAVTESVGRTPAAPHWQFSFAVENLDLAFARAIELGAKPCGEIPESVGLGPRRAIFDDPTGAAVAFHQADS